MKVYLIKDENGYVSYQDTLISLEYFWDSDDDGITYTITREEMTEEEYNKLTEFEGF